MYEQRTQSLRTCCDRGIAHAATVRELQNRANKAEAELQRQPAPTPVTDGDKIPDKWRPRILRASSAAQSAGRSLTASLGAKDAWRQGAGEQYQGNRISRVGKD